MAYRLNTAVCLTLLSLISFFIVCIESKSGETKFWSTDRFVEHDLLESNSEGNKIKSLRYLKLTLDALEKAILYLDKHMDKVNLDGVIGPRQSESKVGYLVSKYWYELPPEISTKMKEIVVLAGRISKTATVRVKKSTPKYYKVSYPLIQPHFYDLYFPARPINVSLIENFQEREPPFTEKESDECLTEFFGNTGKPRCKISHHCWRTMTARRQRYYSLTHEVFYIVNGIQATCLKELTEVSNRKNGTTFMHLLDYFCANVYNEALAIERSGMPKSLRDLFMEQIGLCGDAGYIEIAKWRWLPMILGWQRPNGCYGLFKGEIMDKRNFDPKAYGKSKRSAPSEYHSRVKRSEQLMSSDGCLSHRISVAISAMNTYIRRLVGHYIGQTV